MWVIFALLGPDPDFESGFTDVIESGSNPDPKYWLEHTFNVHKQYIRCWLTGKLTGCPLKYTKEDGRIGKSIKK
jgi:hypothetical protein